MRTVQNIMPRENVPEAHLEPFCDRRPEESLDKLRTLRVLAAAVLFTLSVLLPGLPRWGSYLIFIAAALAAGWELYYGSVRSALARKLDERLPFALSSLLLFCAGLPEEGSAVAILAVIGKLLLRLAADRSRRTISALADLRPIFATVLEEGQLQELRPDMVHVGQTILVRRQEYVPLDCRILDSATELDYSILTGSSDPRPAGVGEEIPAGVFNLGQEFTARVLAEARDSTAWRLMNAVETGQKPDTPLERRLRRLWPLLLAGAGALALIVFLAEALFAQVGVQEALKRACVLLALTAPLPGLVAIPLAYFAGIAGTARQGVLIRGPETVEDLRRAQAAAFDKNGTMTTGAYHVAAVRSDRLDARTFLQLAALAESGSRHAIAESLRAAAGPLPPKGSVRDFREFPGEGVYASVGGIPVVVGSYSWMQRLGVRGLDLAIQTKAVYMAVKGIYAGCVELEETLRPDAGEAVNALLEQGCSRIALFSGDGRENASALAKALGLSEYYAELQPRDKQLRLREMKTGVGRSGALLFITGPQGAGFAKSDADVTITVGGLTRDEAVERADAVVLDGRPSQVAFSIFAARSIHRQCLLCCGVPAAVKLLFVVLGLFGVAPVWLAVTADFAAGAAMALNAVRAYYLPALPDLRALMRGER